MSKFLTTGVFAVLLSLLNTVPSYAADNGVASLLHSLRAERGQVCTVGHFHYGKSSVHKTKKQAVRSAVNHWTSFTELEYGSAWAHFNRAANRATNCEKMAKNKWSCKVKGRPCRKGLSVAKKRSKLY